MVQKRKLKAIIYAKSFYLKLLKSVIIKLGKNYHCCTANSAVTLNQKRKAKINKKIISVNEMLDYQIFQFYMEINTN